MSASAIARIMCPEYRLAAPVGKDAVYCPTTIMRITGGTYRSRALRAPKGAATRPTTDRVREALFGILVSAGEVTGARVLDLYAGTGALALEALSRGAATAVLVESAREAIAALRSNVAALGLEDRAQIVAGDVAQVVRRVARSGPFDLVLADPPWAMVDDGDATVAISALVQAGGIGQDSRVVLEHSARTAPPEVDGLVRLDTRRYGDTALTFYKPAILGALRQ
jgi:16S rRNA (guanine966-N2)-methyltransferase